MISILEPYGDKSSSSSCSISFYLHPRRWPLPASRPFRPGSLQQTLFQVRFLIDDHEYQWPYHPGFTWIYWYRHHTTRLYKFTWISWCLYHLSCLDTEKNTLLVSSESAFTTDCDPNHCNSAPAWARFRVYCQ